MFVEDLFTTEEMRSGTEEGVTLSTKVKAGSRRTVVPSA